MNDLGEESVSDDMLMALADGELESGQAAVLRSRIERDPALEERYAIFSRTAAALRTAYAQDKVPDRLIAAALSSPATARRQDAAGSATIVPFRSRIAWPVALAASLALGIGLGWGMNDSAGPVVAPGLAEVAQAMSDVASGQVFDVSRFGPARVVGSFQTDQGLCRLIAVEPSGAEAGRFLACRQGADWRVVLNVMDGPQGGFVTASGPATEMVDLYLDAVGAGAALDAEAERNALRAD